MPRGIGPYPYRESFGACAGTAESGSSHQRMPHGLSGIFYLIAGILEILAGVCHGTGKVFELLKEALDVRLVQVALVAAVVLGVRYFLG